MLAHGPSHLWRPEHHQRSINPGSESDAQNPQELSAYDII